MELYFIRHGQSENNLLMVKTGSSEGRSDDPELTDVGQEQAERVARFLGQGTEDRHGGNGQQAPSDGQLANPWGITHLYCSPMVRCVSTAQAISQRIGVPLVVWPDLHEVGGIFLQDRDSGENVGLPGKDRTYFQARYPELVLPGGFGEDGWWNRPFEDRPQRPARAQRVLEALLRYHTPSDDRVVWVSHGGFHSYFLRAVLGLPRQDGVWFSLNNVAITRVDFTERGTLLRYVNRTGFLPPELVT